MGGGPLRGVLQEVPMGGFPQGPWEGDAAGLQEGAPGSWWPSHTFPSRHNIGTQVGSHPAQGVQCQGKRVGGP